MLKNAESNAELKVLDYTRSHDLNIFLNSGVTVYNCEVNVYVHFYLFYIACN